ncbi:MAG: penicillin-binding protein activator LpoB [Thermodesulfobacteriota bacterium]
MRNSAITQRMLLVCLVAFLLLGVFSCGGTKVSRLDSGTTVDLSDRWNDTDSRLVAKEMISDMLTYPWMEKYKQKNEKEAPTVILKRIQNKSHEHIAVDTFINDLRRAALRSGKIDFVVGGPAREQIREERKDQDVHAREDSRAEMGQETGADFALTGTISSFVDQVEGKRLTFYQVDLELVNMESNRVAWTGQKKIKKVMERSRFGF